MENKTTPPDSIRSGRDANPIQQLLVDLVEGTRQEVTRLRREGATKEAELSFLEREEKQTPDAAEALEKLKREIVQIKHKLEFFNKQYMALAIQAEDIGQYSADLVRRQDELVGLTRVVNELGLLLERRHTQARLNLSQMHIVARPHVPGYDEDD